jgi:hypothetical protein
MSIDLSTCWSKLSKYAVLAGVALLLVLAILRSFADCEQSAQTADARLGRRIHTLERRVAELTTQLSTVLTLMGKGNNALPPT